MARTGSFSALLREKSGRRAEFSGKLPRSILKAAIPVERSQVLMVSYRSVPCVSPSTEMEALGSGEGAPRLAAKGRLCYTRAFLRRTTVARVCEMCGKTPSVGHNVSHANNRTKRRWLPNLQRVKVKLHGTVKRVRVCTRCIRSGWVKKAA